MPLMFISELQRMGCDVTLALEWKSEVEQVSQMLGISLDISKLSIVYIKPKNKILCRIDTFFPVFRTNKLKKLARDEVLRNRLGTAGRKRVEENFLNTQFADNILRVIDGL